MPPSAPSAGFNAAAATTAAPIPTAAKPIDAPPPFLEPEYNPFEPETEEEGDGKFPKLPIILGAGLLLILAALYYFIFIHDDRSDIGGTPVAQPVEQKEKQIEIEQLYAATNANIRDKPSVEDGEITGKLKRADAVSGQVISGEVVGGVAEADKWLKLEDDKGFVSLINLSKNESPKLATVYGSKNIILAAPVDLWDAPSNEAELLDRLSKGLNITTSGITENGYAEIILKKGGVGYIAGGVKMVEDAAKADLGPPIAIKLDNNGCAAGGEISGLFKAIARRNEAGLKKIEDAKYASDDARDAAIDNYLRKTEGKTIFVPLKRSFQGLKVTGVAQHHESQSVYFAEAPDVVRAKFRSLGYKVGKDGKLPSRDIYASIEAAPRDYARYGKTDLGCGV